jgi:TetR/AcrR family transcriptional repressor of nem operon
MQATKLNPAAGTAELILDAAERRAQVLGFNGFSYADVATELGLTTASIHYHFPSKTDLGVRLIERYSDRFFAALAEIDAAGGSTFDRLRSYAQMYESVLASNRLCLCGMMASEFETLAVPMRQGLFSFFRRNENWLGGLLQRGRESGEVSFDGDSVVLAAALVAALEGAMLVARVHGGVESFRATMGLVLASMCRPRGA